MGSKFFFTLPVTEARMSAAARDKLDEEHSPLPFQGG
jgi:hypothetical protein